MMATLAFRAHGEHPFTWLCSCRVCWVTCHKLVPPLRFFGFVRFVGFVGFVGFSEFVGFVNFVGFVRFARFVAFVRFVGFVG